MRRVCYSVVSSVDGLIAGPNGEADWIPIDPEVDFKALYDRFDTLLVGRVTFETMVRAGRTNIPGMKTFVLSRTLRQEDHPSVTIRHDAIETTRVLRNGEGKDIWIFGGGLLFRTLLTAALVDLVEVTIAPVLLGSGIPLLPAPSEGAKLVLNSHRIYAGTGLVRLNYRVAAA